MIKRFAFLGLVAWWLPALWTPVCAAVSVADVKTGTADAASSVASASMTAGSSGDVYLAFTGSRGDEVNTGVSGLGLTWTQADYQNGGRNQVDIELYIATGAGSAGAVTATWTGTGNRTISVIRLTGTDGSSIGSPISYNTNGLNGADTGGTDTSSFSETHTTSNDNSMLVVGLQGRNRNPALGMAYTEQSSISAGTGGELTEIIIGTQLTTTAGDYTVDGSFSANADWSFISVEVSEAAGAGGSVVPIIMQQVSAAPANDPVYLLAANER